MGEDGIGSVKWGGILQLMHSNKHQGMNMLVGFLTIKMVRFGFSLPRGLERQRVAAVRQFLVALGERESTGGGGCC